MHTKKRFSILLFTLMITCMQVNAQIEGTYLNSKGFSAIGFGAFLNFTVPVTEYGAISAEVGFYSFKKNGDQVILIPILLGYRHMLQEPDAGFYIEPNAGYNIGATDILKRNADGFVLFDTATGIDLEQKAKGFTTGLGVGYIFAGNIAFNLGLRYQRVFVSGDPSLNLFSLRISHPLSFRRRE